MTDLRACAVAAHSRAGGIFLGDNLDVMRRLFDDHQRVHLTYADPPYKTGDDFYFKPRGGGPREFAFSDRWPSLDAYLTALRERLVAARDLLTEDGSLVLHVDPTHGHEVRRVLDSVFGPACFANEIIWRYRRWPTPARSFQRMHDALFLYRRNPKAEPRWTQLYEPLTPSTMARFGDRKKYKFNDGDRVRSVVTDEPSPGSRMSDVWDIPIIAPVSRERTGYPTQKPKALLERIISACSHEGDTVLDPYCGSGTTLVVAKRLRRTGIGIDISPLAVRVSRERLGLRETA